MSKVQVIANASKEGRTMLTEIESKKTLEAGRLKTPRNLNWQNLKMRL